MNHHGVSARTSLTRSVVLTGFMGVGKTVTGRELARLTGLPLMGTDELIAERVGMTVADIFAHHGEPFFRDAETAVLEELAQTNTALILATGGGIVQRERNRELLRRIGIVVNLTATPETVLERIQREPGVRPLLQVADPLSEARRLLAAREVAYAACDFRVRTDGRTPADVAAEILQRVAVIARMPAERKCL